MGDEIQLFSYNTSLNGYWQTTFAWITPMEELSYVVTITWKDDGVCLTPEFIKYGATFTRPVRKKEIWKVGITDPAKIAQSENITKEGTPEHDAMVLAKMLGYERFLQERVCFPEKHTLNSHLKAIADEYLEHFEPFMLAVIMGVGPLVADADDDDTIAQFKKIALSMVRRFYPQLIAHQITTVQPMNSPNGLIYYMRYRSASGLKKWISWRWLKGLMVKCAGKARDEVTERLIRWKQRRSGPSWLVQASDLEGTARSSSSLSERPDRGLPGTPGPPR